jgi:site-specific DNA-methyltransferase (adenine-specific)
MPPATTAAKKKAVSKESGSKASVVGPPRTLPSAGEKGSVAMYLGDCRETLPTIPEVAQRRVRLVFADPPFNWNRAYDEWKDSMPDREYCDVGETFREKGAAAKSFTMRWLDLCVDALTDDGSMWINIPDTWAAEIVVYLKERHRLHMVNWCVWHYRFGQNTTKRFINSKVHALYFCRDPECRVWNTADILETSDRRAIYGDARTESKRDGMPPGQRVPMDVWYGQFWGRIQGNNKERRPYHDNQLPEVYLERVILACSDPGDVVLDPFIGSGTTAVVAREHGRHFVGTEFSEKNLEGAFERCGIGMLRKGLAAGVSTAIHPKRRLRKLGTVDE